MKRAIVTIGQATPGLSDHQSAMQLVTLIGGADSLELKLTVPESDHQSAVAALGMDTSRRRSVRSTSSTHQTLRSITPVSSSAGAVYKGAPTTRL